MSETPYVRKEIISKDFWNKLKPRLSRLDIELTERCNNNCLHCYINLPIDDLEAERKELSTDEIKKILTEAESVGCMQARFTGGEPLLRNDFSELYVFARKHGFKVYIFTNATLLTPSLADLFSRIPPGERIEVTVYGMKKESYETVSRTSGSFEAAWRGINLLLEKKIPFVIKGALLPSNKDEIEEFEKMALNIPWMDKPPSYSMFFDLRGRRDNADKNQVIKGLRISGEEGLKVLTRGKYRYIKEMKEFCAKFMGPQGSKLFSCGAAIAVGCIDAYGMFQPCMKLRHHDCIYDLRKGSLKDAVANFSPRIRKMKAENPEYLSKCARCFLKGLCEQCPAASWMEHGALDTPVEYLCAVAHRQAQFLGLVKKGEFAWDVEDWQERVKEFAQKREV